MDLWWASQLMVSHMFGCRHVLLASRCFLRGMVFLIVLIVEEMEPVGEGVPVMRVAPLSWRWYGW